MCGIVGFWNTRDDELLRRMAGCLRHRGPDSEGFLFSDDASLGIRRLSIIDVQGGGQPISNETGRIAIVFNGEIYNYRELRAELTGRGHVFRTQTDTEVILHLYEEAGPECCGRLNGMFAFAIWDADAKILLLARDHLGVKPLYYAARNGQLAFGSELKALAGLPWVSKIVSPQALHWYLSTGSIPSPHTILTSVNKLPPGHVLAASPKGVQVRSYWSPPAPASEKTVTVSIERIAGLLDNAVRSQLMSERPLGVFLSGGLDSSTIVALASRHVSGPLRTFTVGYQPPDESYSELDKARLVARHFGCDHTEFILSPRIDDLLVPLVRCFDEPFADSSAVPNYLIAREAHKHVTVALTGVAGDELFAGYPRYLGLLLGSRLARLPSPLRRTPAVLGSLLPDIGGSVNWTGRSRRFLKQLARPLPEQYRRWTSFLSPEMLDALLVTPVRNQDLVHGFPDSPSALARLDLTRYLPADLLCLTDRTSMAHSLEARVPFCDMALVEHMARIPLGAKVAGLAMKSILKKAVGPLLPRSIVHQTKKGFAIPLARWVRDELDGPLNDLLGRSQVKARGYFRCEAIERMRQEHRSGRENHADALWGLLMLELWHREYA